MERLLCEERGEIRPGVPGGRRRGGEPVIMRGVRGVPGGDPPEPLDVKDGGDGRDNSAGEEDIDGDGRPTMEFTIWLFDDAVAVLVGQCCPIMFEEELLLLLLLVETTTAATAAAFPSSPAPFKFN